MHLAEIYVEDDDDRLLNVATVSVTDIPRPGEQVALKLDGREERLEVVEVFPAPERQVPEGEPLLEAMLVARSLH